MPNGYEGKPIIITNERGFSAVITGFYANDEFTHEGYTVWWTSTDEQEKAWLRSVGFFDNKISLWKSPQKLAFLLVVSRMRVALGIDISIKECET